VSLRAWESLDAELKAIVTHACAVEAGFALSEMERLNAEGLAALIERHGVQLRSFPAEFVAAARKVSVDVLADLASRGDAARKVHDSYVAFRARTAPWSRVSIRAVLEAREG
jgi:TRAP-type mannitol/chloroaromatic compound transport system substrate-binding protein